MGWGEGAEKMGSSGVSKQESLKSAAQKSKGRAVARERFRWPNREEKTEPYAPNTKEKRKQCRQCIIVRVPMNERYSPTHEKEIATRKRLRGMKAMKMVWVDFFLVFFFSIFFFWLFLGFS